MIKFRRQESGVKINQLRYRIMDIIKFKNKLITPLLTGSDPYWEKKEGNRFFLFALYNTTCSDQAGCSNGEREMKNNKKKTAQLKSKLQKMAPSRVLFQYKRAMNHFKSCVPLGVCSTPRNHPPLPVSFHGGVTRLIFKPTNTRGKILKSRRIQNQELCSTSNFLPPQVYCT